MKIIKKQQKKSLYLLLELNSTSAKSPEILVLVNGDDYTNCAVLVQEKELSRTVSYQLEVPEIYSLEITLLNKTVSDTIVSDGCITEDLNAIVKEIVIAGLPFTDKLRSCFKYIDTLGVEHDTSGFMHVNGTLSLTVNRNMLNTFWLGRFN